MREISVTGRLAEPGQRYREHNRRQEVVVDADGGHGHAVHYCCVGGHHDPGRPDAARDDWRSRFVEERDLAEPGNLEDPVFQDAVLLGLIEAGVLQVGGEGLQHVAVARHIAADRFCGPGGDIQVAGDDRFTRAGPQRQDRDDAEDAERQESRASEDQGEAPGDVADPERHVSSGWSSARRRPDATIEACSGRRGLVPNGPQNGC